MSNTRAIDGAFTKLQHKFELSLTKKQSNIYSFIKDIINFETIPRPRQKSQQKFNYLPR